MAILEKARAKVGATILDVFRPGWEKQINLKTLDLASCEVCVLGQLFGSFEAGATALFAAADDEFEAVCQAGFDADDWCALKQAKFPALTTAWKTEIKKRKTRRAA